MAHKFDISNRGILESEERKRLFDPYGTLRKLGFQKGDAIADIGCGLGLFALPAAELGGEGSMIYAVDVSEEMLAEVAKRAEGADLRNITAIRSAEYEFMLEDESADIVLICMVLHEVDDKRRFLEEASRICRRGGRVAVIEANEKSQKFGPPPEHRLKKEIVAELLSEAGFVKTEMFDISDAVYVAAAEREV